MALDANDIEVIRATWLPVRQDQVASGCLLFKELFTRYPQYLQLFPQFPDLDLEHMRENKRLLKHAVKVIDTVSFVVDSLGGNSSKMATMQEALVNLVKGHLKRQIGSDKFRNLGIVLIDFICIVNANPWSSTATNGPAAAAIATTTTTTTAANQQHQNNGAKAVVDTDHLKSAWAKLYGVILDLVKQQEEAAAATATATD